MLVGALMGPTVFRGASGFVCINDVWFARPLYVPSGGASLEALEEPRRFFAESASFAFSSYQLLCLVASLLSAMGTLLSAVKAGASSSRLLGAAPLAAAVTTAVFLRRLTLCPASSSEEEKSLPLSLSFAAGGGVAGRLRRFALPFAPRFLKRATGALPASVSAIACRLIFCSVNMCVLIVCGSRRERLFVSASVVSKGSKCRRLNCLGIVL